MKGKYTKKSDDKMDAYLTQEHGQGRESQDLKRWTRPTARRRSLVTLQEDLIKDKGIIRKIRKDDKKKK
jgi:hypothetical protein